MACEINEFRATLQVTFERQPQFEVSQLCIRQMVIKALMDLHGQVGGAIPFEMLHCLPVSLSEYEICLSLSLRDKMKLWSALTMLGSYGGVSCSINAISVK